MLKKKKSIKEREELAHKGRSCAECEASLSQNPIIWRAGYGVTHYFCSLKCYVTWMDKQ